MYFEHAGPVWRDFPALVPGVVHVTGISAQADVRDRVAVFTAAARERQAAGPESGRPEIQAWRRAFAQQGLKPTQYRCASESLLRRLRKEGSLPDLHPLVTLANAISAAYAIPVGVFDLGQVTGDLTVRYAHGDEDYLTFSGETERPAPGEVIFADSAGHVHARRWTNRQSGRSAVQDRTERVLIVAEALHESAATDVASLLAALTSEITAAWPAGLSRQAGPAASILTAAAPRFSPG
jgi:DNA/RNA-binding domain of Phe-tRNA-synthetase-like protein